MAIVISADGKVYDRTDELVQVPDANYVTQALGLFQNNPRTQKHIQIVRRTDENHLLVDRNWDERDTTILGEAREYLNLSIPHYPAKDAITPNDLDGVVNSEAFSTAAGIAAIAELETVASVRARKMVKLRNAHDLTLEAARMRLITTGDVYAPRGTVVTNFYTEFGITQPTQTVDFSGTTDPRSVVRQALAVSRNAVSRAGGGAINDFVVLCSSSFFDALISNPYVTSVAMIAPGMPPVLQGTGNAAPGLDARYASVRLMGALWIDVGAAGYTQPGTNTFVPFVADDEAYIVPRGVDGLFQTYYAPANRFSTINRVAQSSYWFEYLNEKDDIIEIQTEQNFLNACTNPGAIVKLELA